MAKKINLEHSPNCYLHTGGAPVEPCCTCGAQDAMDEIDLLKAELKAKDAALEKLARLGNEPYLGNSEGNIIAQQALKED